MKVPLNFNLQCFWGCIALLLSVIFYGKEKRTFFYALLIVSRAGSLMGIKNSLESMKVTILSSNIEVLILDCHKTKTILHMTLMFGTL